MQTPPRGPLCAQRRSSGICRRRGCAARRESDAADGVHGERTDVTDALSTREFLRRVSGSPARPITPRRVRTRSRSNLYALSTTMAPKSAAGTPAKAPGTSKAKAGLADSGNAVETLWRAYVDTTPGRLKFIDSFLVFLMLSGVMQFLYCILVTNFPFNAFLAGCAQKLILYP